MAWQMSGTYYGPCSCKVGCPCELGELEADQGWCSGVLVFDIERGRADGVDLSGTRVVLEGDWPGGFLQGNGTARLYFDPAASQQQRSALEAIIGGQRGGLFEPVATLIAKTLPSREAPIKIEHSGDETHITVGSYGDLTVKPLRGATGELTTLLHGAAAFRDRVVLAKGTGSRWRDPEMRQWESLGHAEYADFDWSA